MIIWLIISFITSFATMSYAMISAVIVSDFTGEEILSQCLTMGPYLLGLGLGSLLGDRIKENKTLSTLWNIEWGSVLLLPLLPVFHLLFVFFYLHLSPLGTTLESKETLRLILMMGSILSLMTGLLGGAQLPLIIRTVKDKISSNIVLAANYMGPLFAGPFIIMTSGSLPVTGLTVIVALIQVTGLLLLLSQEKERLRPMILLALPLILLSFMSGQLSKLEYLTVKASYMGTKMSGLSELSDLLKTLKVYGDLERVRTPYQMIDFFKTQEHPEMQIPSNATLYLNRKTQFDMFAVDVYHQSMIYSGLNLLVKNPEHVLILGAGDGLLLKEIKNIQGIKTVTMVELDPVMIEWSRTNEVMKELNEGIYDDLPENMKVITEDAVSWLRKNQSTRYDLILIDFPFPNGHELAKLYSKEFYELVKKVTTPESLVVIDLPVQIESGGDLAKETKIILKTLSESGFKAQLPFGPVASFIAVTRTDRDLAFNYDKFPSGLALSTRLNLVRLIEKNDERLTDPSIRINSMFWPGGL